MSKRINGIVSRDSYSIETSGKEPSWFSDFVNNLEKVSVKSKREDHSLFDQINSILGNKSKYSTVEEAVLDMQKRTGLLEVLNQRKQAQLTTNDSHQESKTLENIPALKTFIDNYVEDRPGTSVDAVVHDLLKIRDIKSKLPEGDDVPNDVKRYINDKITEVGMQRSPSGGDDLNLGKLDLSTDENTVSDNDPFAGCEPVANK